MSARVTGSEGRGAGSGVFSMKESDHDGQRRSGVWLPDACWDWLDRTSQRDGTSRSDLLEGLVLLAMDDEEAEARRGPRPRVTGSEGRGTQLEPIAWLTERIEATDDPIEKLMLSVARDALDMNGQMLAAIRGHRFDTEHLVEKLGDKGYHPRLADQMLYEAAGLARVLTWIERETRA